MVWKLLLIVCTCLFLGFVVNKLVNYFFDPKAFSDKAKKADPYVYTIEGEKRFRVRRIRTYNDSSYKHSQLVGSGGKYGHDET